MKGKVPGNFLRMFLLGLAKTVNEREIVKGVSTYVSVRACQNCEWKGKYEGIFLVCICRG